MMRTTCYSFGGEIFLQEEGAGIGLRGSAALAKIVMAIWDQRWAYVMRMWQLTCHLFIRYVDDIRIYTHLLKPGWYWTRCGWRFNSEPDTRDPVTRTLQELNKSFDCIVSFLNFTTEWEGDFESGFLPTLDMETKVNVNGRITYRFFRKPTCNNLVVQNGTCLPKNTVFSALRQEVIRRLLNTSGDVEDEQVVQMIEDFIQLMRNSQHQFSFIKAVVMQGLTKFQHMKWRSNLSRENPKYTPLH